jgi:hypothetical protein
MRSQTVFGTAVVGHSTITLTLDTYSHVMLAIHTEVAERMDGLQADGGADGLTLRRSVQGPSQLAIDLLPAQLDDPTVAPDRHGAPGAAVPPHGLDDCLAHSLVDRNPSREDLANLLRPPSSSHPRPPAPASVPR